MANFMFTGELKLNALDSRNPFIRKGTTKSGLDYATFGAAIVEAENNRAFVELFGQDVDTVRTFDTDNNKIEVDKDDCFDADVIASVARYRKNIINIIERKEFIRPYDAVKYLEEHASDFNGQRVTVTGQVNKNIYNGKITDRFQIQNIYLADPDAKNELRITLNEVWDADCIDTAEWKENKKIFINGYTETYIDKDNGNKYVPQQIILDASKLDFDKEKHLKAFKFRLSQLMLDMELGKIKTKQRRIRYMVFLWCAVIRTVQNR